MRFGLEGAVRRRILAALLAGIMVFSQTGTAFAAENAAAADTAVEAAVEEEPEAEAAVVEEPEEPEGEKEPEVAPAEGAENEDTSADEIQDEVTTDDEEPGDTVVDESEDAEEESVEEADEGITEEAAAETDETVEEPEEEVAAKESKKEDEHWSIELDPEDAPDGNDFWIVFSDDTLEIVCRNLIVPEGAAYNIEWKVGTGGWDDGSREFDGWNLVQNDGWHVSGDGITLDGGPLWNKGIRRVKVRAAIISEGEEFASSECEFDVEESFVEPHWNFGTHTLLPGWDQWIDRRQGGYVQNKQHPWGDGAEFTVTGIQCQDVQGQNVVNIEDESEDGWRLRAQNGGESKITVNYADGDGRQGTEEFTLYVADSMSLMMSMK